MNVPYANMRFFEGIATAQVTLIVGFTCIVLSLICLDYGLSSQYFFHNWVPFYRIYYKFHNLAPIITRAISIVIIVLFFSAQGYQRKTILLIAFLVEHYFVLQSWDIEGIGSYFFPLRIYIKAFSHERKRKEEAHQSR